MTRQVMFCLKDGISVYNGVLWSSLLAHGQTCDIHYPNIQGPNSKPTVPREYAWNSQPKMVFGLDRHT